MCNDEIISIEELKKILKIKGFDYSHLEDEELKLLVNMAVNEIVMKTGREIVPVKRVDTDLNFDSTKGSYLTRHYPIKSIKNIYIDKFFIPASSYVVDYENGIIKFLSDIPLSNSILVEYTSQEPDSFIKSKVIPLITDIVCYNVTNNDKYRNMTSISEGKTSISLGISESQSLMNSINYQLLKLKKNVKTRML